MRLNLRASTCKLAVLTVLLTLPIAALIGQNQVALHPGDRIPAFELKDQAGQTQTFDSLKGANGLLLMFNRSADWCPFCKSQLIDFESARKNFEAKGIRVASITYDSPAVLKMFAERKSINFPLLSDPDSKTIDAFGVRNLEVTGTQTGIAIPSYYLIGPDGVIRDRWEENTLQNRVTASYFYETLFGPGTASPASDKLSAPHLNITLTQSDRHAAPGARIRLTVQLAPGKDTHLYALGAEANGYHPVKLILDTSELYSAIPAVYPKSTTMEFPRLQEKVPVFESETIITQDVTAVRSPGAMVEFSTHPNLVIHGSLEYQACTSTICFPPEKVPVHWTLNVRAEDLDSVRVADDLQRK